MSLLCILTKTERTKEADNRFKPLGFLLRRIGQLIASTDSKKFFQCSAVSAKYIVV